MLEPVVENDWDIFFAGVIWPSGHIKANVQFEREIDRDVVYETAKLGNEVVALDAEDRRPAVHALCRSA